MHSADEVGDPVVALVDPVINIKSGSALVASGDHGGTLTRKTNRGSLKIDGEVSRKIDGEVPIKIDVENHVEGTNKDRNLMPMAGAKCEFVNAEWSDGGRSFSLHVANPCPYNVGVCVDSERCGFVIMGYNLWSTYDTISSSILGSDYYTSLGY